MFTRILIRIGGNALALYAANRFVAGFHLTGSWKEYLLAALVLAILNWTIKPILKAISFPLIILTLGLFTLVINALMLVLLDRFFDFVMIADKPSLLWATVVVSLINLVISHKL